MDPIIACCSAIVLVLLLLVSLRAFKIFGGRTEENEEGAARPQPQRRAAPVVVGGRRNVARRRHPVAGAGGDSSGDEDNQNGRRRVGAAAAAPPPRRFNDDDDDGPADFLDEDLMGGEKVGKKKMAKLQAKAEKRAQREADLQEREERKQREKEREERQRKNEEKEKAEEAAREEAERVAKEEQERREHEEYLKLKEAFAVEEEGYDVDENLESENLLQEFIQYIKNAKVVSTDELASQFKLRAQDVVDRIRTLESEGSITGVIDDRGKFIYISPEELKAVAKFINQRGRVSVSELAEYSNKLIRLEPEEKSAVDARSVLGHRGEMAKIWLRGEYLLNAHLPLCPPHRIITFNIAKMVAYAKSKGIDGYPSMTYDCWRYLAMNKLQMCQELAEVYFDMARQTCKSVPTLAADVNERNGADGDTKKKRVPLIGFAVFLFMQQANRLNLRASMSGLEKRPRTYSEREGRGRRSSFSGTMGQENIEQKVMEFLMTNLQALLELISVYEGEIKDYHAPKPKGDSLTRNSIVALDLILEGHTMESESVLPLSAIIATECDWVQGSVRIRKLEDFIRRMFQADPFAVVAPFSDIPFATANDVVNGTAPNFAMKRSSSETRLPSPDLSGLKLTESTDNSSPRGGKIVHNAKTAPKSHRIVIVHCVQRQTVGKSSDIISNSVLHIGKCCQSHIYMLSPFKSAMIRRCRGTTLVLGPTVETIRLQNCYDCTLVIMCRRLLISDCQRCTIYVKTPTQPLILGSTNSELIFAPYCSFYGDLEKQMAAAGLAARPDRWKQPLVFGNGDSKPVAKDSSVQQCWQLMDSKDFYPIAIPFRTCGSTKNIPGGLPAEYLRALEERQAFFDEWNQYTAGLQDDECQLVKEMIQKEYAMWLEKTGRMDELQQLKTLEAKQRKTQSKN